MTPRLPRAEQIVFTEEFKYFIVTSSLLNDNISMRSKSVSRSMEPSTNRVSNNRQNWDIAAYTLSMLLLLGVNRVSSKHWPDMRRAVHTTITSSLSLSATFMLYRNIVSGRRWIHLEQWRHMTNANGLLRRRGENHFDNATQLLLETLHI